MSYGVLVSGKFSEGLTKQVIVAHYDGENYLYSRITDGGRGESNAWLEESFTDINQLLNSQIPIVGEVLATPLTKIDIKQLSSGEKPQALIQKLTKQYRTRHDKVSSTETLSSVLTDIEKILKTNPANLAKFRSDNRGEKNTMPTIQIAQPKFNYDDLIKVVHTDNLENSLAYIPNKSDVEISGYVKRKFSGITETEIYKHALYNKLNVALIGEAGVGKTTSAKVFASDMGLKFYNVNFNAGTDNSQVFGSLKPNENNTFSWCDGGFTECWRSGYAVILLDELSFINAKMSGMLFPALDSQRNLTLYDNKGEVIPAGENLLIIGAWNENYKGNNKLNEAFKDRFAHKLVFEYDTNIEKNFIKSPTLLNLASQMRADSIQGLYETPISTRLLKNFQKFSIEIGYDYAVESFLNNFSTDEKPSVKLLLDAHKSNLEQELLEVSA